MAKTPPPVWSLYSSAHISIRAVAGIFWSSGNELKSIKHSFSIPLSTKASKLLWRQRSRSLSELKMDWPSDHVSSLLSHASAGWPHSDLPTTLRARGNPLQPFTICNSMPPKGFSCIFWGKAKTTESNAELRTTN